MPKGKAPISGASGSAAQLPSVEEFISVCCGLFRRKGKPELIPADMEMCGRQIREAIRSYLAYQATPMLTATQRQRILSKVVTAARRLHRQLVSGKNVQTAAEKLLQQLDTDVNTRDVVHKHLRRAGFAKGIIGFQRTLERCCEAGAQGETRLEVTAMLDCVCTLQDWTDDRLHWRDPLLVNLVLDLVPVWQQLTGFSPRTVDTDIGEHPFVEWLNRLFDPVRERQEVKNETPLPLVTRGAVEDILARLIFEKSDD